MHPAISVIFFTVMSGAGFGFMALIGLGYPFSGGALTAFLVSLLAGGLAVAGLLSSTLHLGHPERAWRAFSQWRSSWLSREGVLAVATLLMFGIYVLAWMITGHRSIFFGILVALGSAATVFATAMIYAQLKTVPSWNHWLTPVCYLAFALASGLVFCALLGQPTTILGMSVNLFAGIALFVAWAAKALWWSRTLSVGFSELGSDTGTATGLGHLGKVRLFEKPHSGENYLTKEMVHQIGRKHANKLRLISLALGFLLPLICIVFASVGTYGAVWLAFAMVSLLAGLFFERWLFFAEAKHAVSLYY